MHKRHSFLSDSLINDSEKVKAGIGKNIIPPPEKEPLWKQYLEKFKDPIIIVLLVVFFFSIIVSLYEIFYMGKGPAMLLEPMGVLVALLLATGVGFIFEVKAGKEFEILNKVKDSRPVKVFRRTDEKSPVRMIMIKRHDIVVDDIVKLEAGDEIPADGMLLESSSLLVDESNFTGEPYARKTAVESEFDKDATYDSNFLLRGSTVIEGSGIYKVNAVGMHTEEGKGVARTQEGSDVETPLNLQLEQLGKWISVVSFVIATLIIVGRVIYFLFFDGDATNHLSLVEVAEFILASIMIAVTLIVVAVPEGLPMSVTVSLALSMRRMLKHNNLVRKLHACETMGAATVICTDKTGTLTINKMTVIETDFYGNEEEYELIRQNMAVNSTAEVFRDSDGKLVTIGNPTEVALLKWMHKNGYEYESYRSKASDVKQTPFSTETKYMQTTAVMQEGGAPVRFIKGAPEIVLSMCDTIAGGKSREHIEQVLQMYQSKAMRTLGFACQRLDADGVNETVFLGVVGIADPIREDVKEAIRVCREDAHVRVIIVTGDTPGTANEIGRQIGLLSAGDEAHTITGPEFAAMDDESAVELLKKKEFKIISRARPDDKARLVMLLQSMGEVVAVTGDGTTDAPALSKAQVGLSMGDGTSRAKEASDITIIDNSFSSINKAIMWGRSLYLNIRRFIVFQMTINVCACLIVLLGSFIGLDSPLTVTQMLWVNLIMDTFAAMALSSLPADKGVLYDKPRRQDSHIIDRMMLCRIVGVGVLFFFILTGLWQLLWHVNVDSVSELFTWDSVKMFFTEYAKMDKIKTHLSGKELGIFFSIFVMLQFWNLFNAKYFRTDRSLIQDIGSLFGNSHKVKESYSQGFVWILLVILLGQVFIVTFAGALFNVSPLSLSDWCWILLVTSPVLIVADVVRFACNMFRRGPL
ncbi:MAG: calcium-translocating P-type ATPase, PMCA-type [Bacteroidaceae bacterium]|nr:calcium-translocating P-type ATPase, PMCA-type [Bacteroidaceae bacterium]